MSLESAARLALEALAIARPFVYADMSPQCDEAYEALRAALAEAQADAEPWAWRYFKPGVTPWAGYYVTFAKEVAEAVQETGIAVEPLYLHPPRRESDELSNGDALTALRDLVDSLNKTYWSSWQTTAHFSDQLKNAEAVLRAAGQTSDEDRRDAERYRLIRRGQHWSVIDGIGDILRAEMLDAAVDAVGLRAAGESK